MLIEQINEDKIKAVVDEEEQKEYGITYESMNYSDSNTRRLCEDIMQRARSEVGFTVGDSKLLVEARLCSNGSVALYLSKILRNEAEEKDELFGQVIRFDNVNALIDGITTFIPYDDKLCHSNLYSYAGNYYLYFEILCKHSQAKRLLRDLLEFSVRTRYSAAFLDEHAQIITEHTAVQEMCRGRKYSQLNIRR